MGMKERGGGRNRDSGTDREGERHLKEQKSGKMEKVRDEWTSTAWSGSAFVSRLIGLVIMSTVLKGKHVYRDKKHKSPEGPRVGQRRHHRATE